MSPTNPATVKLIYLSFQKKNYLFRLQATCTCIDCSIFVFSLQQKKPMYILEVTDKVAREFFNCLHGTMHAADFNSLCSCPILFIYQFALSFVVAMDQC